MENHMEYLKTITPKYFELYNLRDDREQENDLAGEYPEIVKNMKNQMLQLREEMVDEGGDWFDLE